MPLPDGIRYGVPGEFTDGAGQAGLQEQHRNSTQKGSGPIVPAALTNA